MITSDLVDTVMERLSQNRRVRRTLPGRGRLHIDRQLPFLCVHRRSARSGDEGTPRLVRGEASYLIAPASRAHRPGLSELLSGVVRTLGGQFGGFLVVEIWAGEAAATDNARPAPRRPGFRLVTDGGRVPPDTVEALRYALERVKVSRLDATVRVDGTAKPAPPRLPRLLSATECKELDCHLLGIEVAPIYLERESKDLYPFLLRGLHRGLGRALKEAFFQFAEVETSYHTTTSLALGRRALVKAALTADADMARVSDAFDFLLLVTPVNADRAWQDFKRSGFSRRPDFLYRPRPVEPAILKRRLYEIPIELLEDPVLAQIFRDKRTELDGQLDMLRDRGTDAFRFGSLKLHGPVGANLYALAQSILKGTRARAREKSSGAPGVECEAFAARARAEMALYREAYPDFTSTVEVRKDLSGLMVSRGNLLVGRRLRVAESRVDALIQHEVGTHVVTYVNGRAQPFRQLYGGLPGYDELQEGLAVLAEYLVDGLSVPRLRLLAARVIAVRRMVEGVPFAEAFRELNDDLGFEQRTAFTIAMRVYRGGGLAKDASYLRGLVRVIDYVQKGGDLDVLYVGKIGVEHIPVVEELLARGVLRPPPLRPRFLERPDAQERLRGLRAGASVMDLIL